MHSGLRSSPAAILHADVGVLDWSKRAKLAVVIPFFQRETGALSRAVRSALAQEDVEPFSIIVVDDASPVPAELELAGIMAAYPGRIEIVGRRNGGPGLARNTGLDRVAPYIEYVAFLDSDDEWSTDHLARAVAVLDQGYDFYFADFQPIDRSSTQFKRTGLDPAVHSQIDGAPGIHRFDGILAEGIMHGHVGTPTVVYRFHRFPALRFPNITSFEDHVFWLSILRTTDRVAFSSAVEVVCGKGVNIYQDSDWGTEGALRRVYGEIQCRHWIQRTLAVPSRVAAFNRQRIQRTRIEFIETVLHRLRRRAPVDVRLVARYLMVDPAVVVSLVPLISRVFWRKIRAR